MHGRGLGLGGCCREGNSSEPVVKLPGGQDIALHPVVTQALDEAWLDSLHMDPDLRHEEGGWIYQDETTGNLKVLRAETGEQSSIDLANPPFEHGCVLVATFHTHPNPTSDGWYGGPSVDD